jgi:DNA recombination protein RmuC
MKMEFENISREILEKENERFEKEGIKNITFLVKPLEEEIKNFYYKIEEESKERFSLTKEIEKLRELNNRLSEDASNLTDALKGNSQIQGAWGEMILEKILEESGLEEEREYEIQLSMKKKHLQN